MTNQILIENRTNYNTHKMLKLFLGVIFDLIGMISYIIPGVAESVDLIWAPVSGILLAKMYSGWTGKIAGVLGTIEELIPFTDVIPTFTLTWVYVYIIRKEKM